MFPTCFGCRQCAIILGACVLHFRVLREAYAFPLTSVVLHKWESNGLSTFNLRESNYLSTIDLKNFHGLREQNDLSVIGKRKQCYYYHLLNGKSTPLAYGKVVKAIPLT